MGATSAACRQCGHCMLEGSAVSLCPKCGGPLVINGTARFIGGASLSVYGDIIAPEGSTVGQHGGAPDLSTSVNLAADGVITGGVWGNSHENEVNTLNACRVLITRLNQEGSAWGAPVYVTPDATRPGLDCIVEDGNGATLCIAVTKARYAEQKRGSRWAVLNRDKHVPINEPTAHAVAALQRAIERQSDDIKASHRAGLLLALDSCQCPEMLLPRVVDAFVTHHGVWAANLGYQAIWLVGPVVSRTYRLDQTAK